MLRIIFAFFILLPTAQAANIGFSLGSEFKATAIQGVVVMSCDGEDKPVIYTCRDSVLDPQEYDIFTGPIEPHASSIELTVVHEDGTTRVKDGGYSGSKGYSTDSFNLWISTLFQKPMLMNGVNKVHYMLYDDLSRDRRSYAQGDFVVKVSRGTPRTCPTTQYHSTDMMDCAAQYSICQHYFEQYNNCRQNIQFSRLH